MTPDFALDLSHDGITLFGRAADGWRRMGAVALDADHLVEDLAALRHTGEAAAKEGKLATKLMLPHSQILYTTCAASGKDALADEVRIRAALVGATPYEVSDLVFDWELVDQELKVAVVARETLEEARAFAAEYGFAPVCYATVPPESAFSREPFFGPVETGPGAMMVSPDPVPMKVLGDWIEAPLAVDEGEAQTGPESPPSAPSEAALDAAPQEAKAEDPPVEEVKAEEVETEEAALVEAIPAFHSIRATAEPGNAPALRNVHDEATASTGRKLGGARREEAAAEAPVNAEITAQPEGTRGGTALAGLRGKVAALQNSRSARKRAKAERETMTRQEAMAAAIAEPTKTETPPTRPETAPAAGPIAKFLNRKAKEAAKAPTPTLDAAQAHPQDASEATGTTGAQSENLTVFGAKADSGTRKSFPIGLTAALVVFMAVVGLWSKFFLGSDSASTDAPAALSEQSLASAVPLLGEGGALTRSITFGEAGTSGATLPESQSSGTMDPELADALQAPVVEGETEAAIDTASLADDPFSALPQDDSGVSEPFFENAPLPEMDADPELADSEPEPVESAEPLTDEEAGQAYAESGIWQRAPSADGTPDAESSNDIFLAAVDPQVDLHDAVALPDAAIEAEPQRQPNPLPPGQLVVLDQDGQVIPSKDGVVTSDGITLYAGKPAKLPPVRPGTAATEATAPATSSLADNRPKARPEGLAEENQRSNLGGRTFAELAGLRPKARPQSVQDEAEAARQAAIEEAVKKSAAEAAELAVEEEQRAAAAEGRAEAELQSASRLAIASSPEPKSRPRGFERKVAAVKKQNERQEAEEKKAAANAVVIPKNQKTAPRLPSSANVAKVATSNNALKMRKVNLIGVFGSSSQRRALVRLPSGRLMKVKVGDRVDGGKVASIGESDLRYIKRGKNITLTMPRG